LVLIDDATQELESKWHVSGDHAELMAAADDAAIVRQALSMLSPAERAALVMWEMEGRSTKEIAKELGIKELTVRHTLARARASLRRVMSEMIIDKERGLTALDLLSVNYKKASAVAKKSSKAVLSLVLVFFALVGFNSLPVNNPSLVSSNIGPDISNGDSIKNESQTKVVLKNEEEPTTPVASKKKLPSKLENARSTDLKFPGLDKTGVPTSFTVADSSGSLGSAYFTSRPSVATETELSIGQIFKTDLGAANIFISQTLTTDSYGLSYRPTIAFGQAGIWVPLLGRVATTDISRMMNGNYLFTAYFAVESVVDSPIKISASAGGRDLATAPRQVITRMVLDPSKTQVLAQAVYVVEKGAKA
jgi:DNA-binding CsgD family transcriptional regulator